MHPATIWKSSACGGLILDFPMTLRAVDYLDLSAPCLGVFVRHNMPLLIREPRMGTTAPDRSEEARFGSSLIERASVMRISAFLLAGAAVLALSIAASRPA